MLIEKQCLFWGEQTAVIDIRMAALGCGCPWSRWSCSSALADD